MKTELQDLLMECSTELSDIDNMLTTLPPLDKSKQYLTKYALMKTCGTLEYVYRSIVADYFDRSTITQIHTYIEETIRKGSMSAKYQNMCGLLGKFDPDWQSEFKSEVNNQDDGNRMISAADSLVTNRNLFAHGRNPTATFSDIKQYYEDAVKLIEIMDSIVQ